MRSFDLLIVWRLETYSTRLYMHIYIYIYKLSCELVVRVLDMCICSRAETVVRWGSKQLQTWCVCVTCKLKKIEL